MKAAATALSYAFLTWMVLTFGTYLGIRAYLYRRGEPAGWRFNHHGAHAFPGHLSFYQRGGGHAIRFRAVHVFPLFWKVERTPEPGEYHELETVKRGAVWSVIPWAHRYMSNYGILSTLIRDHGA